MSAPLINPVILCGGGGTRLWPRSRRTMPKPFLPLVGEATLFEEALARCSNSDRFAAPLVVTGAAHRAHVEVQSQASASTQIIIEPSPRNTAAAIALAALRLPGDAIMLVCPSDQHIGDEEAFRSAVVRAAELATQGWLVSLGIAATRPDTGFGYLEQGEAIGELGYKVARFIEKPDRARAVRFLADGGFAWNGGIFAFRADRYLAELAAFRPAIAAAVQASVAAGREDGVLFYPEATAFDHIDGESVDYAVMENTAYAAMVPADMDWSDIGNWQALHAALPKDAEGNAVRGRAELVDCCNVLIDSDGPRVSVIGLNDVIVVVNGDEVLVTSVTGAQAVGKLSGAVDQ